MKRKAEVFEQANSELHLSTKKNAVEAISREISPRMVAALANTSNRTFMTDASIIFVGPRGSGKSSLAVIAARILDWQFVDAEGYLENHNGRSRYLCRVAVGVERNPSLEQITPGEMLYRYDKRCAIAYEAGTLGQEVSTFLRDSATSHPIIYTIREDETLQRYLHVKHASNWIQTSRKLHRFYRRLSTFEIFNLDETVEAPWQSLLKDRLPEIHGRKISQASFQTLRNTRKQLCQFLRVVLDLGRLLSHEDSYGALLPSKQVPQGPPLVLHVSLSNLLANFDVYKDLDTNFDAVQLNVDGDRSFLEDLLQNDAISKAIATMRRHFGLPLIYHINSDCIKLSANEHATSILYLSLLHLGIRAGPDFMTVDLQCNDEIITELIQTKKGIKLIGRFHNERPHPKQWISEDTWHKFKRGLDMKCDVVELSQPCLAMRDNLDCEQFVSRAIEMNSQIPLVAYNTTALGRLSQILNANMTPVTIPRRQTPTTLPNSTSNSLTTAKALRETRCMLNIVTPLKFYVFGAEVKYSMSPTLHNAGFQACGLPYEYQICEAADLSVLKTLSSDDTFGGASISLPFKSEVLSLADNLSLAAKLTGAANTLLSARASDIRKRNSRRSDNSIPPTNTSNLIADNTDWMGIYACLARHSTPANQISSRTSAVVIGAGGMARAAIFALLRLGIRNIFILNRTLEHAKCLKKHFDNARCTKGQCQKPCLACSVITLDLSLNVLESLTQPWPEGTELPNIIVQTIPAHGHCDESDFATQFHQDWLNHPTGGLILEVAWQRGGNMLDMLNQTQRLRWTLIDGIEMLYEQGCAQFELFTGCKAPRRAMLDALLSEYARGQWRQDLRS